MFQWNCSPSNKCLACGDNANWCIRIDLLICTHQLAYAIQSIYGWSSCFLGAGSMPNIIIKSGMFIYWVLTMPNHMFAIWIYR